RRDRFAVVAPHRARGWAAARSHRLWCVGASRAAARATSLPGIAGVRLRPDGRLVINAIRKSRADQGELESLDYARHLWMEREIKSVANVTRADVREMLADAA